MSSSGHASVVSVELAAQSGEIQESDEIQADVESDDGQQRLRGQSVGGERPRMWHNTNFENSHVRVSIFRVPEFLKDTKRKAYVPQTVSLGPLHHKSEELAPMNNHKERALRRMMNKMKIKRDDMAFPTATLSVEYKMRPIYEKNISYDGKTLAWMLCLDGFCILEVLRTLGGHKCDPAHRNDLMILENKLLASNILKDIVMLENQIPWIVLLELLRLEKVGESRSEEVGEDLVKWELMNLLQNGTSGLFKISWKDKDSLMDRMTKRNVDHILDFLYEAIIYQFFDVEPYQAEHPLSIKSCIGYCLLMLQGKHKALDADCKSIPTAVELQNAGIKFRPCNGGISGITFDQKRAIIYLPVVYITYGTEVLFGNLIAWEMCKPSERNFVSSYVNLMDDLIDSREDVALLRSMGILTKLIGSDKEVADLFNGLCKDVGIANMADLFVPLKGSVNKHYRDKIRVQFAELVRDHFSSYWKALATVGAIAILGLAIVQTIFTIKSAHKK